MKESSIIRASDGCPLNADIYDRKNDPKGAIALCPGLGIPKEYYHNYCNFLSDQGYVTIVFDYRGIGENEEQTSYDVNLRNWGILDIPGVLNWIRHRYPKLKIYLFGHSIAGQVAGMMSNYGLVDRFVFFSSTTGYWTMFDFPFKLIALFQFYFHIPMAVRLFGFMPPGLTYRGVRIDREVATEWAAWSRRKDYISYFFGKTIQEEYYNAITQKIDWISFTDDPITTDKALSSMMDYYPNATINHHRIDPKELHLKDVGHAGFFNKKSGRTLWQYPLELL